MKTRTKPEAIVVSVPGRTEAEPATYHVVAADRSKRIAPDALSFKTEAEARRALDLWESAQAVRATAGAFLR